jgi:hypothetical protein
MEKVGIKPRIARMGSAACAGEVALKPRSNRVRWIVVKPTGKTYELLILIMLVCWVHKLQVHKGKPISMGGHKPRDIGLFALFQT